MEMEKTGGMMPPPLPHYRHRFPAEIISHAVWLYHAFSLSLRDVELLLAERGILQADAYAGFNDLYHPARKPGPITEAACWAHGRRKLFVLADVAKAPLAIEAVRRIDAIFDV